MQILHHWPVCTYYKVHRGPCSGWPQSRRKNSPSFPGFSRAIYLLLHRLSQQKVNVIMTFINGLMILFTQSTAVLHKHLNDKLKTFVWFVTIFPWGCTEFPENSRFVATLLLCILLYYKVQFIWHFILLHKFGAFVLYYTYYVELSDNRYHKTYISCQRLNIYAYSIYNSIHEELRRYNASFHQ